MIDIKACAKAPVRFCQYKDGNLWYKTINGDTFPVPIEDIGNATFYAVDKGLLFMRYMRMYNETLENK